MTDEVITELAAAAPDRLAILARTTSMQLKGTPKDLGTIGRELSVDYVVEGAARRIDHHVQITAQLVRTSDRSHVFARRYEAEFDGLFRMEGEIARAIVQRLGVVATSALEGRTRRPPVDLVAYSAYIKGRHHQYKFTPEGFGKAKDLFEEAVRREPSFALAHLALAELYWDVFFNGVAPKDACTIGLFYALRALEIDNTIAETHALVGQYRKELDYNWAEVQREMRLALDLAPHSPIVRLRYAISGLLPHGRLAEAAAELASVLESDPLSLLARFWLVATWWLARNYTRAVEEARRLVELDPAFAPGHMAMGFAAWLDERHEEAICSMRTAADLYRGTPIVLGWLGLALGLGGRSAESRSLLDQFRGMANQGYVPPTCFAWTYFGLGEVDEAFAWMDKAIDARDPMMVPLRTYPFLDPVRHDPRFRALLSRMNLEP